MYLTCQLRAAFGQSGVDSLFDSLRIWKIAPERRRVRPALNSGGGFLTELSCIAANR